MSANEMTTVGRPANLFQGGPSILDERPVTVPVAGRIRPGIKVLTSAATQHKDAQAIYDRGVSAGKRWSLIERELVDHCGFKKSPLTPKNVPYFTVFRHDFAMPEIAEIIMTHYGEDRGEGTQLYRLPVVFGMDSIQTVMPHKLQAFTRRELKFWSEYDENGQRMCMTHAPVLVDPRSKRPRIPFGGRPKILREDNGGVCDPEKCVEYQSGACKLSGGLLFYVPGVPGAALISLPTTSLYSLKQIREKLLLVSYMRGGRISGTNDGKPFFYLVKRQQEVSMLDRSTGEPKKVKQWIVGLEENIDMTSVMASLEAPALLQAGGEAAAALAGTQGAPALEHTPEPVTAMQPEPESPAEPPPSHEALRKYLRGIAQQVGIDVETLRAWADSKYPNGAWREDDHALSLLIDSIEAIDDDPAILDNILTFRTTDL